MKRLRLVSLALLLLPILLFAQQPAPSSEPLGDVARDQQHTPKKPATRVVTNDDIPSAAASTGASSSSSATSGSAAGSTPASASSDGKASAIPVADLKKRSDYFRSLYTQQKSGISLLERELNVLQREYQIQTAEFYTDAGTRLRNEKAWAEKHQKYEEEIAAKKKQLDEARQKMDELKEQARKAGVPSTIFDD